MLIAMELTAIIISILALVFSFSQFIFDYIHCKKADTIAAYNRLQDDVFINLIPLPCPLPPMTSADPLWQDVTVYLAKIEHFSVGINTGIYSIKVLNRLGGAYFIRQFERLWPVIDFKRKQMVIPGGHADEFEKMVNNLKKLIAKETENKH